MIDPAIIDLMHHMSKAPPAIERPAEDSAWVKHVDAGDRHVQTIEKQIDDWVAETELRVAALSEGIQEEENKAAVIHRLNQAIEAFEATISREAAFFRRAEKKSLVPVKKARSASAAAGKKMADQRTRILRSFSKYGLAKQDVIFSMRALRADLNGSSRSGPVFDDPKKLGDFLRAAVA